MFGYILLGDKVESNILLSDFGKNTASILIAKILMTIHVIFAIPYNVFPTRDVIFSKFFPDETIDTVKYKYILIVNIIIYLITCGLASISDKIGIIIDLQGDLMSPIICFIAPCLF